METILLIAAEAREFSGLVRRLEGVTSLDWPVRYAREARHHGQRWLLVANGPGTSLARKAFETAVARTRVDRVVSTGYCGALDPSLAVADVFTGDLVTTDRVVTTAQEKAELRSSTGASAVDMEAAAVAECANRRQIPFQAIRVVSDTAREDLPLDLNATRDATGHFSTMKILSAALRHPMRGIPGLVTLARNASKASESLGAYLAGCQL